MDIIDCSAILTKTQHDRIITRRMITLTGEYDPFSSDRHLMDESLITKCIDDTIERREIHPIVSLSDERLLHLGECDASGFTELLDEAFA